LAAGKNVAQIELETLPMASMALSETTVSEIRRHVELVAGTIAARAQLVVGSALVLVAQHLVGLIDRLEAILGIGFLADVRVELARQLAVGGFDLGLAAVRCDAKLGVVVLEFHPLLSPDALGDPGRQPYPGSTTAA